MKELVFVYDNEDSSMGAVTVYLDGELIAEGRAKEVELGTYFVQDILEKAGVNVKYQFPKDDN